MERRESAKTGANGCQLRLTLALYDLAVAALGARGEFVESATDLPGAIALKRKPACVNTGDGVSPRR